jgi:hypothetical protein
MAAKCQKRPREPQEIREGPKTIPLSGAFNSRVDFAAKRPKSWACLEAPRRADDRGFRVRPFLTAERLRSHRLETWRSIDNIEHQSAHLFYEPHSLA